MVTVAARREGVRYFRTVWKLSERRACHLASLGRSTARDQSRRADDTPLQTQLLTLAQQHPRYGYRRLHALLRRAGWRVNRKRVERLYRAAGLAVRRSRRKRSATARHPLPLPVRLNARWSMDFVEDRLAGGRPFRTFNVIDDYSRECLVIDAAASLPAARVVQVLEALTVQRGRPDGIVLDNGPEFTAHVFLRWATRTGITLDFIQPGKPVENAFVESFNGKFRDECLNQHWFLDLADARQTIEVWRQHYNQHRPHSALGYQTPDAVAAQAVGLSR